MAFFMDGFDYYNTAAQSAQWWDLFNTTPGALAGGVFGYGRCTSINAAGQSGMNLSNIPGAAANWATFYCGFHYRSSGAGNDTKQFFQLRDAGNNQVALRITAGGLVKLYRNGTLLATGTNILALNNWYWLAIKAVIDNAGSFRLDIKGPLIDATDINFAGDTQATANAYCNSMVLEHSGASGISDYDNFHVYDGSDAAPWNAISAERRVYFALPTGDGALTAWTPSAGARYQCVDENPPTDDTDYISDSTPGNRNTFTMPAFSNATVDAVKLTMRSRRDDAGPRGIKLTARIGGTNYDSAEFLQGASYIYLAKYWLKSPATAAAWGLAEVNGAEWGVDLST